MASISERALCEIVRRLRSVRVADGYDSDAGLEVTRARYSASKSDCFVVWDAGEVNSAAAGHPHKIEMLVDVEGVTVADQQETGERVGAMKADAKRAVLAPGVGRLFDDAGQIGPVRYVGAQVRPREQGHSRETLTLTFAVSYVEGCGNPESPQSAEKSR